MSGKINIWFKINQIFEIISEICLAIIVILLIMQIVLRNIFLMGLPWIEETARFLFISLIFLVIPHLVNEEGHIQIDIISNLLKGWIKKILRIFICCICFAIAFLVSYYTIL